MESFVTNLLETLLSGGRVMVGKTGVFSVERQAAYTDDGKLYPPSRQLVFTQDDTVEESGSGSIPPAGGLRVWMPELRAVIADQLAEHADSFEVKGVGVFVREAGTARFVRSGKTASAAVTLPVTPAENEIPQEEAAEALPEPEAMPVEEAKETVPEEPASVSPEDVFSEDEGGVAFEPAFDEHAAAPAADAPAPADAPAAPAQSDAQQPAAPVAAPRGKVRRRRRTGWLVALVILLLALGAGGGYLFSLRQSGRGQQPVAVRSVPATAPVAVPETETPVPAVQPEAVPYVQPEATIPAQTGTLQPAAPAAVQPAQSAKEPLDLYVYTPDQSARYYVIVSSLTSEQQAVGQLKRLSEQGLSALRIVRFDTSVYRLVAGPGCSTYAEARTLLEEVRTFAEKAWIFQNQ